MNQLAMIVKATSESLTNPPTDFSTRNATICCTSENAGENDLDAIFRKSPSELLKYLLVINRDTRDSDVIKTNAIETAKERNNESSEQTEKIVSVTNKTNPFSFCNSFHYDKPSFEMGVFSLSCDSAKCGSPSVWQPLPEVKHGRMDGRCDDVCETSESDEKFQSHLFFEQVQNFRDVFQRTISSEESTRTEQYSDDDIPVLPEDLPPETLEFILSRTEKELHIESPGSGPKDSASECSELTELCPLSDSFPGTVSQFSPIASTSKQFSPVNKVTSTKTIKKAKDKGNGKDTKDVEEDEMVLVPSGKL